MEGEFQPLIIIPTASKQEKVAAQGRKGVSSTTGRGENRNRIGTQIEWRRTMETKRREEGFGRARKREGWGKRKKSFDRPAIERCAGLANGDNQFREVTPILIDREIKRFP